MTDINGNSKHVIQLEMSAYKEDSHTSELFALSNATETATLTIVCFSDANAFAFSVHAEFSNALHLSSDLKQLHERHDKSTSQIVSDQIFKLQNSPEHWMAVYVDACCVRVFGRGKFECYFFDSMQNYFKFGGFQGNEPYINEVPLSHEHTLTMLVTTVSHNNDSVRYLIEASNLQKFAPASLTCAYITELVKERAFCVLALFARRLVDTTNSVFNNVHNAKQKPASPRRSRVSVLDSQTNFIRTSRHRICQSSDIIECDIDAC